MKSIWLVMGETGEYGDWTEWIVAAYPRNKSAKAHALALEEHEKTATGKRRKSSNPKNPYDPDGLGRDYNGASYCVMRIPITANFGEFKREHGL